IFVGTIEPRKNLVRLLEAMELLHEKGEGAKLVIVGSKGWLHEDFFRRLAEMPRGAVFFPGYVPDEDLPAFYSGAALSALPSLYEGFGLPVLEAMACGTPVACSRTSSLPEVAGDAAAYFDPTDVEAMAEVMHQILSDEERREEMRARGLAQAAQFSWARAAEETMAVYEQVIAKRSA
nr:glycosyltransferase family 4 protein [Chloroflexota bacterium]